MSGFSDQDKEDLAEIARFYRLGNTFVTFLPTPPNDPAVVDTYRRLALAERLIRVMG